MDTTNRAVAAAVRDAIWRAGKTQSAVADEIGMNRTTWQRRITGKRAFQVIDLLRVARVLGADAGRFLDTITEKVS
ncbi:helix-turn-helix transcriptional regulator [Nocardia sp. NPDC050793]|uniref:helix-turn-helix domain-containing protein n=1 Tax=Nocardia sp. NPDC050793 TaxID=3155159 RepID=UPI0033F7B2CF